MKKLLLFAIITCHLQLETLNCSAQPFRDTLLLTPDVHSKVMLVAAEWHDDYGLEQLVKYRDIDTIKNSLVETVESMRRVGKIPANSTTADYFINEGESRVRFRVEDPAAPANVKQIKTAMRLHLPAYEFIIHDMQSRFEYFIYVDDLSRLEDLKSVNLSDALKALAADGELADNYYLVGLARNNGRWAPGEMMQHHYRGVAGNLFGGATIIGSQVGPLVGVDFGYTIKDKFGVPQAGFFATGSGYVFSEVQNRELMNVYPVYSYGVKLMANLSTTAFRTNWMGVDLQVMDGATGGWLNKGFRFGVTGSTRRIGVSIDYIYLTKNNSLSNVSSATNNGGLIEASIYVMYF